MKQLITLLSYLLMFCIITSCAASNNCADNKNYTIEYYSGGGFTGLVQGITVNCSGLVQFWDKKLNSPKEITDSTKLSDDQLKQFNLIMADTTVFLYNHKYSGNMTTYLDLTNDDRNSIVSFDPAEVPGDMPPNLNALMSEIKKINNK